MVISRFVLSSAVLACTALGLPGQFSPSTPQSAEMTVAARGPGPCGPIVYQAGDPKAGGVIELCVTSGPGCAGCVMVSLVPGPAQIGPFTIPVGLPLEGIISTGVIPGSAPRNELCFREVLDPSLAGVTFYIAFMTTKGGVVEFSPAISFTVSS